MPVPQRSRFRKILGALALALSLVSMVSVAAAADGASISASEEPHRYLLPWSGLGSNALGMFSGSKAILDLSAVAATLIIVESGLDKDVHNYFARHSSIGNTFRSGVALGAIFPAVLGAGLFGSGLGGGSPRLASAGSAVLQASLLALATSTTLKALTGRAHPEPVVYRENEAGETFRFGFLRGGAFWGWPSGHLLANTAAVTSLLSFYNHSTWLKVAGGAYLGYLWLSVISHGRSSMHWFSDTVAGTLLGCAIGTTVGSDFRRRWEGRGDKRSAFSFVAAPALFSVSFSLAL